MIALNYIQSSEANKRHTTLFYEILHCSNHIPRGTVGMLCASNGQFYLTLIINIYIISFAGTLSLQAVSYNIN